MKYDLALVMPVYNEEACIEEVVRSWYRELTGIGMKFVMLVLNDGSRDGTGERLSVFDDWDEIRVIEKNNSGHGPTILQGYRIGSGLAEWVFQTDSDDEMKPHHFRELWRRRREYDALFGYRQGRKQSLGRSLISAVSRRTVNLAFGRGVLDVNTPYRLLRAGVLKEIVEQIPADTFAPNVLISGHLVKRRTAIYNHPVPHEGRSTGTVSIVRWRLWKASMLSFLQTLKCRLAM